MASRRALCLLLLLALLRGVPALAQQQAAPAGILRGYLQYVGEWAVTMGGSPMQLAPGAIIRNQMNLIVVPASVPGGGAWADYMLDKNGQIFRAWLLTPEELSRPPIPRRP
jgi:hypothetical protein